MFKASLAEDQCKKTCTQTSYKVKFLAEKVDHVGLNNMHTKVNIHNNSVFKCFSSLKNHLDTLRFGWVIDFVGHVEGCAKAVRQGIDAAGAVVFGHNFGILHNKSRLRE